MAVVVEEVSEVPLTVGGVRLRASYRKVLDLMMTGKIEGRRDERGRWLVSVASIERYLAGQQPPAGS